MSLKGLRGNIGKWDHLTRSKFKREEKYKKIIEVLEDEKESKDWIKSCVRQMRKPLLQALRYEDMV